MFLLNSIKGRRCSLLKDEQACRTASGARKSDWKKLHAAGTPLLDQVGACWLLGGLMLAPGCCDVGQKLLAICMGVLILSLCVSETLPS